MCCTLSHSTFICYCFDVKGEKTKKFVFNSISCVVKTQSIAVDLMVCCITIISSPGQNQRGHLVVHLDLPGQSMECFHRQPVWKEGGSKAGSDLVEGHCMISLDLLAVRTSSWRS